MAAMGRDILDLPTVVPSEVPIDAVDAALALALAFALAFALALGPALALALGLALTPAILGVEVMLNTLLIILASARTALLLRLTRSDWMAVGSIEAHAGMARSVTGGAVAKEYWSVVGKGTRDSMLLAREESWFAGMSKAISIPSDVATGPLSSEDSYAARAEAICPLWEASMVVVWAMSGTARRVKAKMRDDRRDMFAGRLAWAWSL
jgi:hypothetical protein